MKYNIIIEVQGQIVHAVITFTEEGEVKLISSNWWSKITKEEE